MFGVYLLVSDFLVENLKANKKLAKNITHFTTQFCLKNLSYFTNLINITINIIKNILPQHSQKSGSGWSKKTFALHCFQTPKNCILEIFGKQRSECSCRSPLEHFCSNSFVNNMSIKQQINHGAIPSVRHLYNGIFHFINLCHTLSILLQHLPCVIHFQTHICV